MKKLLYTLLFIGNFLLLLIFLTQLVGYYTKVPMLVIGTNQLVFLWVIGILTLINSIYFLDKVTEKL